MCVQPTAGGGPGPSETLSGDHHSAVGEGMAGEKDPLQEPQPKDQVCMGWGDVTFSKCRVHHYVSCISDQLSEGSLAAALSSSSRQRQR